MSSCWRISSVLFAALLVPLTPALGRSSGQVPQELPAGAGRDVFVHICSGCHSTTLATSQRKSADDWATIVIEMRSRGASGSDDEMESIVDYLAHNFGVTAAPQHININTAVAADLVTSLALTPEQAAAIVTYREKNGSFKDIESLERVPGIDIGKIEAARNRIDF